MRGSSAFCAAFCTALLSSTSATAYETHTLEHWHNLNVTGRMQLAGVAEKSPAVYYLELQPRMSLWLPEPEEVLLRAAVGYEVFPRFVVLVGACSVPVFDAPEWKINETRLWQQISYNQSLESFNFGLRLRLEERGFAPARIDGELRDRDPTIRLRTLARVAWNIPETEDKIYLVAWDELFIDFYSGYDQNRAFAGAGYRFAPWFAVEAGYINVPRLLPDQEGSSMRHAISLTTVVNLL